MYSNSLTVAYTPNGFHSTSSASTTATSRSSLSPIEVYDTTPPPPTTSRFSSHAQQQHHNLPELPWDRLKSMPAVSCGAAAAQLDETELPDVPWARLHSKNVGGNDAQQRAATLGFMLTDVAILLLFSQPKDLDSIDRLDDPDCVDATAIKAGGGAGDGKQPANGDGKKQSPQQDGDGNGKKGENEGTVTFLYYALQCCDCTIS